MSNIFHSDFYRLRQGNALRNMFITLLGLLVFYAVMFRFTQTTDISVFSMNVNSEAIGELKSILPRSGAEFAASMLNENYIPVLFLGFFIMVFGTDFSSMTFRNTLSFETNRNKVYLARLGLSITLCFAALVFNSLCALSIGAALFGFGGFNGGFFLQVFITLLLQAVLCVSLACIAHCILAFTQKNGITITIYLVGIILLSSLVQGLLFLFPTLKWLLAFDFITSFSLMAQYASLPFSTIAVPMLINLILIGLTGFAGITRYQKMDFA